MIRNPFTFLAALFVLLACSEPVRESAPPASNQSPSLERAIEVVQKESGVYLYRYAETIEPIDPRKDYTEKYRIFRQSTIEDLRNLVASNREYEPEFKARCLPVWDAGLEFRDEGQSVMFLFSFRCNTIRYVEGNLFKDFTPQRTAFYKIFQYEINDESAVLIEKR
ncbi:MAG: hypothetical protein F9K24_00440 [Leptonema illini]|jgi:hypothetical protein|uniref:Lipoprotein n=1 Tax=Leptonema illini TaxID=183 RepID=A0A833H4V4_9LEPT|nr:MAG: hypothetical protein F9K24_00440 [Leptonema illini]PKL34507.1 MAG: hypothetical protein CVV45_02860 [Spirochaetae bacterium HGW-Spirochaetae-10]